MVRIVDVVLGLGRWTLGHQKVKRGSNTRASLLGLSAARPGIRRWAPGPWRVVITRPTSGPLAYPTVAVASGTPRTRPALTFTATEWDAFTAGVRTGEFD